MDKFIWRFLKKYTFGVILIFLEFALYSNFPIFITQQVVLLVVTFYLARISYIDEDGMDLKLHQVVAIALGITYGLFATVAVGINAVFFYGLVTFITKYAHKDSKYFVFTYIILVYFIYFYIRIIYFSYQNEPSFTMYDYFIKNLLLVTAVNSIFCFTIMIKNKKNNSFSHYI